MKASSSFASRRGDTYHYRTTALAPTPALLWRLGFRLRAGRFEESASQAGHLLDDLAEPVGIPRMRETLDVVGQSPNDGYLGSKTGESKLYFEPAVVVRFEGRERGNEREHRLRPSNGEAKGPWAECEGLRPALSSSDDAFSRRVSCRLPRQRTEGWTT